MFQRLTQTDNTFIIGYASWRACVSSLLAATHCVSTIHWEQFVAQSIWAARAPGSNEKLNIQNFNCRFPMKKCSSKIFGAHVQLLARSRDTENFRSDSLAPRNFAHVRSMLPMCGIVAQSAPLSCCQWLSNSIRVKQKSDWAQCVQCGRSLFRPPLFSSCEKQTSNTCVTLNHSHTRWFYDRFVSLLFYVFFSMMSYAF